MATATVRIDAAAATAVAERQAGHAADFGASDDDGSGDEGDGRNGLPLPPLPVNEATARAAWSVLCASVLQKSMFSNVLITRQPAPDELLQGRAAHRYDECRSKTQDTTSGT